jgi:TadE-like protein.
MSEIVRRGKSSIEGSFTVEAAFIVPLVTMILVLLIDMALYMRDLSTARTLAERVAEDTRALVLNDEEPRLHKVMYERQLTQSVFQRWFAGTDREDADNMDDYLEELSGGRFWISRMDSHSVRVEDGSVVVRIALVSDTGIPMFGKSLTSRWFSDEIVCRIGCADIGFRTRFYAAAIETGTEVKGLSTVLTKLSELVNRLN